MKKKFWIIGGIALVAVLFIAQTLTGGQPVEVLKVAQGDLKTWVEDTAYVQARDEVVIQASQSGKIVKVAVEVGQKVAAGQELLVMENLDMQYQQDALTIQLEQLQGELDSSQIALDQSRLDLEEDQKNLQRNKQLFLAGAISQAEYDASVQKNLSLKKDAAKQALLLQSLSQQVAKQNALYHDLGRRNLELIIKSPQAGTILDLPAKKEQAVMPGNVLVQVGSEGALELKTELLSDDLAEIKIGQKVEITAPILGDQILNGKVTKIYPRAYEKTSALGVIQRRVPVFISLPTNALLKPGYEVQVKIETQLKPNVITLPRTAIRVNAQGQNEVLAVVQDKIQHLKVQTGLKNTELVEVRSGLKEGQTVVRDASLDIEENARVKIQQH